MLYSALIRESTLLHLPWKHLVLVCQKESLCCSSPCCTLLYSSLLYSTLLFCALLCSALLYSVILSYIIFIYETLNVFPYWQTSPSFEILLRVHAPYLTVGLHRYQCVIWDALLGLSLLRSACFCILEKECKAFSFKWSSARVKFPVWVECVSTKGNCITISIDSVSILKLMSIEFFGAFLKNHYLFFLWIDFKCPRFAVWR